ncbi:hypothetical protein E2C01_076584 [Portunus trituberculatus]|uniref:Uncharacterized protein n=1 Tax=Portunus trituberculatus TaxID=210409 RepID=A0A5B7II10_PORTR|nr:hypothetical protein [Portunus trituberculatus]
MLWEYSVVASRFVLRLLLDEQQQCCNEPPWYEVPKDFSSVKDKFDEFLKVVFIIDYEMLHR